MKKAIVAMALACATNAYAEEQKKEITLDGEFGLILTTGNTETTSFKAKLSSHHELENWSNDYVAEALYKQDEVDLDDGEESQTTAQKWFVSRTRQYKLGKS